MKDIVLNKNIMMSSREIAELTGKEHKNIKRDIVNMCDQLKIGALKFEQTYLDSQNKKQTEYLLPKNETLCLISGYNVQVRMKIIKRWQELESKNDCQYAIPKSLSEALRLSVDLAEQNEALQIENQQKDQIIGEYRPKIEYLDQILASTSLVTITQIAKDYGMSGNQMNDLLYRLGVQFKQSGQWLLYMKYHNCGYTHSQTIAIRKPGEIPQIKMNTKWTQKGRIFIYNLLKQQDILPKIEQQVA
jgi:Rha family phage regulatory protein